MPIAAEDLELLCCPRCQGGLQDLGTGLRCPACAHDFEIEDGVPKLFWPTEWDESKKDVTETVKAFYEETPFPNYDDFDSPASLAQKARQGHFARLLDEQIPAGARILECGCGTGQLSNFLSISNRSVWGTDICMNSLRLGHDFARRNGLENVRFLQMNLFRPAVREEGFHLVVSNGVLHHTADPRLAFESIARLVRPGGFLLVGLYHQYGRLTTDARRVLFRITGGRFKGLDPNLRMERSSDAKKRAWFADQYQHPHESKHTIGETLGWLDEIGFEFVRSLPTTRLFATTDPNTRLFEPEAPGSGVERFLAELSMIRGGSREGGFFIVIGKRPR